MTPLRILHVLRAPVGGLFRYVVDLAREQTARGHAVGVVADAATGGERAEAILVDLAQNLELGVSRVPMSRQIGVLDIAAVRHVAARARETRLDVLHGHGAKGGAYARLAAPHDAIRVYTPHGGSLHYDTSSIVGLLYLTLEKVLARRTDLFLFESNFGRDAFIRKVGQPVAMERMVHNGVAPAEFEPVAPWPDARDIVFVGELRRLKGVDLVIEAIARLRDESLPLTATIVGAGPDAEAFRALAAARGLTGALAFPGAMPAREAFAYGRVLCMPSRAESLPYVVLEAAAAGLPLVATRVGGMAEIFGEASHRLVPPDDVAALAQALRAAATQPNVATTAALRERVRRHFSVSAMADGVLAAYCHAIARRRG
ncbi:glycosyltransferase [Blastochloris viridis]|uniref:Glycosyltransferase n=1 Tax=Blastochloris viridis TaxID=1079 RepID=A0A182D6I9_BLAVI|nr:glycosyltransferase [Blastochloris viridis]ALK09082.1 Putative teichuronic acid biosynthesis glycosyltransferase TuaC [Blastochloris viridis]BAS01055.1 glycosyltransferase [Blastochloris viridis]